MKTLRDGTVRVSDNPGRVKLAVVERHRAHGPHRHVFFLIPPRLQRWRDRHVGFPRPHNIVVAGDDEGGHGARRSKMIEEMQGGIVMVARGEVLDALPLPVAGLISDGTPEETAAAIRRLTKLRPRALRHFAGQQRLHDPRSLRSL